MRSYRRLAAACALALLCAPGTCLRTPVPADAPRELDMRRIAGAAATADPAWQRASVWHLEAPASLKFGGYSAMFMLGERRLRAFSDRGFRLTFTLPDVPPLAPGSAPETTDIARMIVGEDRLQWQLWDIEAATRDPANGDYWLAYENTHAIHRFSLPSEPEGVRLLEDEVDWYDNGGLEALVRLADGRFVGIPEGRDEALIYPGDPVEGGAPEPVPFAVPTAGFAVTDMAQLPDGRLLMLLRDTAWGLPPFTSALAIADPPPADPAERTVWRARLLLDLDAILPRENYEGLAIAPQDDGRIAIWLISDDNFSALQRTLLAKLVFDPRGRAAMKKARRSPGAPLHVQ